jgi:hypothetical protein
MRLFSSRLALSHRTLLLAWLAIACNAAAPVLAYVYGDVIRHAGDAPMLAATGHGAFAAHDGHHVPDATHDHSHSTPHCPYCLDFASGAPLATPPLRIAIDAVRPVPPAPVVIEHVHRRPSVRVAEARAPPAPG